MPLQIIEKQADSGEPAADHRRPTCSMACVSNLWALDGHSTLQLYEHILGVRQSLVAGRKADHHLHVPCIAKAKSCKRLKHWWHEKMSLDHVSP